MQQTLYMPCPQMLTLTTSVDTGLASNYGTSLPKRFLRYLAFYLPTYTSARNIRKFLDGKSLLPMTDRSPCKY